MRLYLDDNCASPLLATLLRKAGHDVQLPGEVSLRGKDDAVHLTHAIAANRDLKPMGIVRAIAKLVNAGLQIPNVYHVLNQWR